MDLRFISVLLLLVACAAPLPEPLPSIRESLQGDARPSISERSEILRLTDLYLQLLAHGRLLPAYNLHSDDFREQVSYLDWRQRVMSRWNSDAEPVEIRWRQGLHRFEGPELYAIVLLSSSAHQLVWRQDGYGGFVLESAEP